MFRTFAIAQCALAGAHVSSNHETLSMAGALAGGNHVEEQHQLSMADMIAQSQGSDMQAFYKTEVKSPPMALIVSKFQALEARFLEKTDPALLPEQGYDMHDHKAVSVKEVAHKDMESITGDWGSEYGPHHVKAAQAKPAPSGGAEPAAEPAKAEPAPADPPPPKSGAAPVGLGFAVAAVVLSQIV